MEFRGISLKSFKRKRWKFSEEFSEKYGEKKENCVNQNTRIYMITQIYEAKKNGTKLLEKM